jgi:hypothetical protein
MRREIVCIFRDRWSSANEGRKFSGLADACSPLRLFSIAVDACIGARATEGSIRCEVGREKGQIAYEESSAVRLP